MDRAIIRIVKILIIVIMGLSVLIQAYIYYDENTITKVNVDIKNASLQNGEQSVITELLDNETRIPGQAKADYNNMCKTRTRWYYSEMDDNSSCVYMVYSNGERKELFRYDVGTQICGPFSCYNGIVWMTLSETEGYIYTYQEDTRECKMVGRPANGFTLSTEFVSSEHVGFFKKNSIREFIGYDIYRGIENLNHRFEEDPELVAFSEEYICWTKDKTVKVYTYSNKKVIEITFEEKVKVKQIALANSCLFILMEDGRMIIYDIWTREYSRFSEDNVKNIKSIENKYLVAEEYNGDKYTIEPVFFTRGLEISNHLAIRF